MEDYSLDQIIDTIKVETDNQALNENVYRILTLEDGEVKEEAICVEANRPIDMNVDRRYDESLIATMMPRKKSGNMPIAKPIRHRRCSQIRGVNHTAVQRYLGRRRQPIVALETIVHEQPIASSTVLEAQPNQLVRTVAAANVDADQATIYPISDSSTISDFEQLVEETSCEMDVNEDSFSVTEITDNVSESDQSFSGSNLTHAQMLQIVNAFPSTSTATTDNADALNNASEESKICSNAAVSDRGDQSEMVNVVEPLAAMQYFAPNTPIVTIHRPIPKMLSKLLARPADVKLVTTQSIQSIRQIQKHQSPAPDSTNELQSPPEIQNANAADISIHSDVNRCQSCVQTFKSHKYLQRHLVSKKHQNKIDRLNKQI